jgi:chromosome partitioning protein
MSRIIAFANQKGGVGKTTTCVNLADAFTLMNRSVLLVDFDPQGNATMGSGIDKNTLQLSANEVLLQEATLDQAVQASPLGFDVLPSNGELTVAEVGLLQMDHREQRLKTALRASQKIYDFVLIDCPPSLNMLTVNALVAADSVIIPLQCEYYALEGLSALLGTVDQLTKTVNPTLEVEGLLRTMVDNRSRLTQEISEQLQTHFSDKLYQTLIPRNVRVAEAPSHGMSVIKHDKKSSGAEAYIALAGEILRRHDKKISSLSQNSMQSAE